MKRYKWEQGQIAHMKVMTSGKLIVTLRCCKMLSLPGIRDSSVHLKSILVYMMKAKAEDKTILLLFNYAFI